MPKPPKTPMTPMTWTPSNVTQMGGSSTPSASGIAGPQTTGGGFQAPPELTNTAAPDPNVKSWLDQTQTAYNNARSAGADPLLQESINNLRQRQSTDTTGRAIDRAQSNNADIVAGQRNALKTRLARSGMGGQSGLLEKRNQTLDDNLARANARTGADITLGRERDLDNLAISGHSILSAPGQFNLAQQGMANNLLGMGMQGANSLAGIGLAQQNYGLNQWNSVQQAQLQRQQFEAAERARREGQLLALSQMM